MMRIRTFLAAALLILGTLLPAQEADAPATVLSIMDFTDHSGDADLAWLSAGLADMLLTDLAPSDLVLVDRDRLDAVLEEQSLALAGITDDQALQVGRLLMADALMYGSYALVGDNLRIDARISEVSTGEVITATSVRGGREDVLDLEARLARDLCTALGVPVPVGLGNPGTVSLPAARAYYEGLILQRSGAVDEARMRFEAAAELDPLYAKPRYSLEESWQLLKDFRRLREQREVNALWTKAEALERRLAADPFVSDQDRLIAAYTAGSPTVRVGSAPEDDPTLGSCPSPAVCLWNLQITYWEIGNRSKQYFDDEATERAALNEMIRLARRAEEAWPEDEWLPEILYWEVFAHRWLGEWESVRKGCERFFIEWPGFRMAWALEDMYAAALEALGGS